MRSWKREETREARESRQHGERVRKEEGTRGRARQRAKGSRRAEARYEVTHHRPQLNPHSNMTTAREIHARNPSKSIVDSKTAKTGYSSV
jgi:hypothetical protein